jgi:putative colanic acid biosynthesis glycosyltransferase
MNTETHPLLSIIIVTFNDDIGLARTLSSIRDVMDEGARAVEAIVIDGAARAETLEILHQSGVRASVVSEPDHGVYDAMNKGIDRARGEFAWFLNGGDECVVRWDPLRRLLQGQGGRVVLTDYELVGSRGRVPRRSRPAADLWHALPTSHQAIFYPRSGYTLHRYDESYRIAADYAFTAALKARGVRFVTCRLRTAAFYLDGMSTDRAVEIGREAARVQRDVLGSPAPLRKLSKLRHAAARAYRGALSRSNNEPVS